MKILKLENVSKYYKSAETVSVGMKNVTADFEIGEFVAITGESGSGKSTLLNVISGLDGYEEGEVYHYGEETSHYTINDWEKYRSAYIGFVFQNYNIIDSYTVYQNVVFALEVQGYPKNERRKRALELIDRVGLSSHKNHKASKLSGGQKQRAVIARALAKDCPIIVADEPTGNLDSESAKQIMELLNELSKEKLVIVVTHDYSQVEQYATRRIKMHDGTIVEDITLKKHEVESTPTKAEVKKVSWPTIFKISLRNIFSTPKRTIFMLVLQILVISIFTIVYSGQVKNIRETGLTSSRDYPSVPETRLLIERRDGQAFTTEEITDFKKDKNVIETYLNHELFYNDRQIYFTRVNKSGWGFVGKTDSAVILNKRDVEGRLPETKYEIVFSSTDQTVEIGDIIGLTTNPWWGDDVEPDIGEFKVVGIDKLNRNTVYFSEEYLNQELGPPSPIDIAAYNNLKNLFISGMTVRYNNVEYQAIYNESYTLNHDLASRYNNGEIPAGTIHENQTVIFLSIYPYYIQKEVTVSSIRFSDLASTMFVKKELYDDVLNYFLEEFEDEYIKPVKNLLVLEVDGYYYGNEIIKNIDQDVYKVYYPANIDSPIQQILVFVLTFLAAIILFFLGMFLYSIVHAVSKNVMANRKNDFAIFRSIGTNKSMLAKMVVLEQVIINLVGFVITMLVLFLLKDNLTFIRRSIAYMRIKDYFILMGIFLLFGIWLGLRFNKRVFNQSVIEILTISKGEF